MKRLFSLLCLLLCACICFPAFSVSASAQEVDGNTVYTYWYIDNVEDLQLFENTIISLSTPYTININATVILSEPIPSNTLFDLDIGLMFSSYSEPTVEVQFVEPGFTVIGSSVADIVDNHIIINNLQYDYEIARLYLKFPVTHPHWTTVQTVYDFTIDGVTYECEKYQTWSAWCASSYNTLGLYVDNGFIYYGDSLSGKILKSGNENVLSSDLVDKDKSYYLEQLEVAPTIINFYIGSNQCSAELDMTWDAWIYSEYNTLSLIIDGDNIYSNDMSAVLQSGGSDVLKTSIIVSEAQYSLATVLPKFIFNGQEYEYEAGMTWGDFVNSSYNVIGLYISSFNNGVVCPDGQFMISVDGDSIKGVSSTSLIRDDLLYYDPSERPTTTFSRYQYEFDFSITSVTVIIQEEDGLLNGIISWLKNVVDSITDLPSTLGNMIKGLFIPSEESIIELKDKFEELLRDRFGAVYDSADIIDDFASSFAYTDTDTSVSFPEVTVNLVGTDFTFGGWEVDVIPDGFEGIVDSLKFLISIVSTVWFVNALRKRLEDILE